MSGGAVNPEGHWEGIHRTKLDAVSWYQERPTLGWEMLLRSDLKPGAKVLDVGSGASFMAEAMIQYGFIPVLTDLSSTALKRVQDRLGHEADRVTFRVGDIRELELGEATLDGWHDRAVFHFFTDPADQQAYVRQLLRALRPGGTVVIGGFAPDGPEKCSGLPVCRHDAASLSAALGPSFECMEHGRESHATPFGTTQSFLVARFRFKTGLEG